MDRLRTIGQDVRTLCQSLANYYTRPYSETDNYCQNT